MLETNDFRARKNTSKRRIIFLFIYSRLLFSSTWEGHATLFLFSLVRYSVGFESRFAPSCVYLSIAPSGLGKALTFPPTTWRIQAKEEKQPRTWGKGGLKFPLLQINNPAAGLHPKSYFQKRHGRRDRIYNARRCQSKTRDN